MRRIDVFIIGLALFGAGGLGYIILQAVGLDSLNAGIWSQFLLVLGLVGWVSTYLFRFFTKQMTFNQQLNNYKDAVLQKQLDALSPEELAKLLAEVEAETPASTTEERDSQEKK